MTAPTPSDAIRAVLTAAGAHTTEHSGAYSFATLMFTPHTPGQGQLQLHSGPHATVLTGTATELTRAAQAIMPQLWRAAEHDYEHGEQAAAPLMDTHLPEAAARALLRDATDLGARPCATPYLTGSGIGIYPVDLCRSGPYFETYVFTPYGTALLTYAASVDQAFSLLPWLTGERTA